MSISERIAAFLSYLLLPIGWLVVLLFGRRSAPAVFHCKQSIALVAFVLITFAAWGGIGWLLTWIPFGDIVGVALFSLVIVVMIFAVVAWVMGMSNALAGRMAPLPIIGGWVRRFMP
jgi:uncharacterized membrane protein